MPRSGWLQVLARGEAGAMLMLAYSSMRGYGGTGHGAIAELRAGELPVRISHPITGRPVTIGHVEASEVHYIAGGFALAAGPADRGLPARLRAGRRPRRAQGDLDGDHRLLPALREARRHHPSPTRSSSSATSTRSSRPASSSTSSCRTT